VHDCQSSSPYEIMDFELDRPLKPRVGAFSIKEVGFACAKWVSDQRVRGDANMVINQISDGHYAVLDECGQKDRQNQPT
jgi:hypothetical protein